MFAESLLESRTRSHTTTRSRQGWATALSVSTQLVLLAGLASVSLLHPVDLPAGLKLLHFPIIKPAYVPIISAHAEGRQSRTAPSAPPPAAFQVPSSSAKLYFGKSLPKFDPVPTPLPFISSQVGKGNDMLGKALDGGGNQSVIRGPVSKPIKLSRIDPGQLLFRPQPVYPVWAKQAGIEGQVVLTATISKSGTIETLQVRSGQPLLAQAAENAIRQWRYRPYILNGEAVEVETQITVDFKLGR